MIKFFTGSANLSIICFIERYKAEDHNSILLFLQNFLVFFHKPKEFHVKLVCFEKALTILFVLIFPYSAQKAESVNYWISLWQR
jgi:hypothetical protein